MDIFKEFIKKFGPANRVIEIKEVTCVTTAKSMDDGVRDFLAFLAGGANQAQVAHAKGPPDQQIIARDIAMEWVKDKAAPGHGQDDLQIRLMGLKGTKIWPSGKDYEAITSQQTLSLNLACPVPDMLPEIVITLVEYDSGSANDLLGSIKIPLNKIPFDEPWGGLMPAYNEEEGSSYLVDIEVRPREKK